MAEQKFPFFTGAIVLPLQDAFRRYKKLLYPKTPVGYDKLDERFVTKPALFRLMLFSAFCMAFAFLFVKALSVLILTGLLRLNNINHIYSLFSVVYLPGDDSNWSDGSLLLVYGLPTLTFLAIGMYLTGLAVRIRKLNWIFRLLLGWIAFNLITFFMSELVLAAFFYKGLGIALEWLISNRILKYVIIVIASIGLIIWSKRFGLMFLRCSPSRIFIDDTSVMRTWLLWILVIPLFFGPAILLMILFFSLKISLVSMFGSAMLLLPMAFRTIDYLPDVRIYKSKKIIPGFVFTLTLLVALGVLVRLLIRFV